MRALVKLMAAMAAAGVCGSAQAGKVVAGSMDAVTGKSSHTLTPGPLDVAKTPSPAGPVPTPYPNIGMGREEAKTSPKVKETPTQIKNTSAYKTTTGDEAGTPKGVVSGKHMDKADFKKGASKVKVEGKKTVTHMSPTGHNGANSTLPPGTQVAPSQTKVMVSDTAAPAPAQPSVPENTGPTQVPTAAIPAPVALRPIVPLTPIDGPARLPTRLEPVKAPVLVRPIGTPIAVQPPRTPIAVQPVPAPILVQSVKTPIVQPLQPQPMTTLQPRPVLTR